MKNCTLSLTVLFIFLAAYSDIEAQENKVQNFSYGIYGAYSFNVHKVGFSSTPSSAINAQLPQYGQQISHGYNIGGNFSFYIVPKWNLDIRLGFASQSSEFTRIEKFGPISSQDGNSQIDAESMHRCKQKTQAIIVEPGVTFDMADVISMPLKFSVGTRFDFVVEKRFEYQEELITPSFGRFETGTRIRGYTTAVIPNVALPIYSLYAGFEVPYNVMDLNIVPNLRYYYPLTSLIYQGNWLISSITFGISIRF